MSPKINELLAVLMMPEKKWPEWFWENGYLKKYIHKVDFISQNFATYSWKLSLADLAFRLRDEVKHLDKWWIEAMPMVCNYAGGYKLRHGEIDAPTTSMWVWYGTAAQPIHWIIAALIAKELANNEQTD